MNAILERLKEKLKEWWLKFTQWRRLSPTRTDAEITIRLADLKANPQPSNLSNLSNLSGHIVIGPGDLAGSPVPPRPTSQPQRPDNLSGEEIYRCPVWEGHQLSATVPCPRCAEQGESRTHPPIECPRCHLLHSREGLESIGNRCARCKQQVPF